MEEIIHATSYGLQNNQNPKYPLKITISQINLIEELSKPPNRREIQIKANEKLNYIKDLIDKKIIEITKDDYC